MKKFNSRGFPFHRGRRLRSSRNLRDLVAETLLKTDDLVMPYFIREDSDKMESKNKFGFKRFSINELLKELDEVVKLGIKSVALFPKIEVEKKTDDANESFNENNLISRALKKVLKEFPDLMIICDVALDPYTSHGHDGVLDENGYVENDKSLSLLIEQALTLAKAGADMVAPSDMMDGRIAGIRESLESNEFANTIILSYACLLYTSPSPRDGLLSRMPSSA